MKKSLKQAIATVVLASTVVVGAVVSDINKTEAEPKAKYPETEKVFTSENNNVGNGKPYDYLVTDIDGEEINGIPLDKASLDNQGILLFKDEVSFDVKVGDKIQVVWGQQEDEFERISKLK